VWEVLIPDRVARSQLNSSHVGVILMGDLNQKYKAHKSKQHSLTTRTESMGLYASLIERFQVLESEYKTFHPMHETGTHIDHEGRTLDRRGVASRTRVGGGVGPPPGLSGFSYQMLSLLPEEMTTDIFRLMDRMWRAIHVPEFWTLKGLVGLPKDDTVYGIRNLRPIGLIKTTRKLWTSMVTGRILREARKCLQNNHCGGLANKGTDTALLQLLNMLEDLQDVNGAADLEVTDAPIDFTSWDTAKAFDSVGCYVQYAAWRRIGVPAHIANWLMS
jgi:hypothetical protein